MPDYDLMTIDQKIASADKFLQWLKAKYPLPEIEIITDYTRRPWLRRKGITGQLWRSGNIFRIEVACDRNVSRVLQTVPHEYKHLLQIFREGIPLKKLKAKEESAAWKFSAEAMHEYIFDVGEEWFCGEGAVERSQV